MAGLLDFLNTDDARLGLGLLAAAGPTPQPMSAGQRIAMALQGVQAQKDAELKRQFVQSQIAETQAQAQQRQAALDAVVQKRAALGSALNFGAAAPGADTGPATPQPLIGLNLPALLRAGYSADEITKLDALRNLGKEEVARTVSTTDAQGRPATVQYDRFGKAVGAPLPEWKAPVQVNQGDKVSFVSPVDLSTQGAFGVNMSPGERASNAVAWANNALSKQRLALEQTNSLRQGLQYDADRGVIVDTRSGTAMPVTSGGAPIGPKDKPLNDTQAKANLFGARMQEADKVLTSLAARGTEQPGLIKRAADSVNAGMLANWTQSAPQQRVEQAQRDFLNAVLRRESGAAIAESEFANARLQYFPQPGDSAEVRAQKASNRALAIKGILAEVPEGKRTTPDAPAPKGLSGFKILGVK